MVHVIQCQAVVNVQWVANSFDLVIESIGGFAGFCWGIIIFIFGGYQNFEKDKSFVQSIYSFSEKSTTEKSDKVDEE